MSDANTNGQRMIDTAMHFVGGVVIFIVINNSVIVELLLLMHNIMYIVGPIA